MVINRCLNFVEFTLFGLVLLSYAAQIYSEPWVNYSLSKIVYLIVPIRYTNSITITFAQKLFAMEKVFEPQYCWLDRVDSTNTYCMSKANEGEPEGFTVAAYIQEQGKGQRGTRWESEEGKNLTFSLLLRPIFLRVEEQFAISKLIALSICDWIITKGVNATIKWPNDIYAGDKKITGILIENSFSSLALEVSVIGIGLNLNQTVFSKDIPNPTSMSLLTGNDYTPEIVLNELMQSIQTRYLQLGNGLKSIIDDDYLGKLYRYNEYHQFTSEEVRFKAKIIGVKPTGELILVTENGEQKTYAFKEVVFDI